MAIQNWVRRRPALAYFALAYAFSWSVWIPMALAGARARQGDGWPSHLPGLFGPTVAAFAVLGLVGGRAAVRELAERIVRWRVAPRWYAVALSPALMFAVAAVWMRLSGDGWPASGELGRFSSVPATGALVMLPVLIVLAYAEEIGWRGYAVPQLQRRWSPLATGLIVGVAWALWHLPSMLVIQNYRELGVAFLPGFFIGIVAGSIFLTWLYDASGGSIWIVALWHGVYNLFSGTAAAHGVVAAIVSTGVIVSAVVVVVVEWRAGQRSDAARRRTPAPREKHGLRARHSG